MKQVHGRQVLSQDAIASLDSAANDTRLCVKIKAVFGFSVLKERNSAGLELAGTEADAQAMQLTLFRRVDADLAARLPAPNDPILLASSPVQHALVHVAADWPLRVLALWVEKRRQSLSQVPVLLPEP